MKPKWKDAPEWAEYLAMDKDCTWWWFANKPYISDNIWDSVRGRQAYEKETELYEQDWTETLEQVDK